MTYIIRSWGELQKAKLIECKNFLVDLGGYFFGDFWLSIGHLTIQFVLVQRDGNKIKEREVLDAT